MATGQIKRMPNITVKSVNVGNVTTNGFGYADISSFIPSTPDGYTLLAAFLLSFSSSSTKDAVAITSDGKYLLGTAGATVSAVNVKYVYFRN